MSIEIQIAEALEGRVRLGVVALEGLEVYEPQLLVERDGTLMLVWRQKTEDGFDLYVAHRIAEGGLAEPMQINDQPPTVGSPHPPASARHSGSSRAALCPARSTWASRFCGPTARAVASSS